MKEYVFWRILKKEVREECYIQANSIDEATQKHNNGEDNYYEVDVLDDEIIDEGTDENKSN